MYFYISLHFKGGPDTRCLNFDVITLPFVAVETQKSVMIQQGWMLLLYWKVRSACTMEGRLSYTLACDGRKNCFSYTMQHNRTGFLEKEHKYAECTA